MTKNRKLRILFLFLGVLTPAIAGCKAETSSKTQAQKGQSEIYIPRDLEDCFSELKKMLKPEDIDKIRNGKESNMIDYHFGLGMWMRNNWGLWKGSRISKWFNARGIHHPDDMSGIILSSFWRHLSGKDIKLEEQITHYQDYWKKQENVNPKDH
jgi:hypothetical protein